ncbi:hypothetical protein N0V83_000074 [Neocucurbitaria cava]|uniref:Uncharacterized protein n=1 Tax=Neocucurbitaria cava TaxID=798079 RepID=A0A9W8YGE2_9PLEO|nr:hypothetical protein N0V83_000074 [Neocucurbitaria cava]
MSWLYRPTNDLCQQFMQQPNAHVCRLPTNFDFFFTLPFDKSLLDNMNPYELHCFYVFLYEILIDVAKTMGRPGVDNIFYIQTIISERLSEIKRLKPVHMKDWMEDYGTPVFDDEDEKLVAFQQEAESTRFVGDTNLTGSIPFHPESFNESKPYIGWHNYENQNFQVWRGGKLELVCMYGGIFRDFEEWRREESNLTKRQLELLQKGDVKILNWTYGRFIYEGRPIEGLDNARKNPFHEDFKLGWQAAVRSCYTPMAIEARRKQTELRIASEPAYRVLRPDNDESTRTSEATNDPRNRESLERQDDKPINETAQLLKDLYVTLVKVGVDKEEARQTVARAALFNLPNIAGRTTTAPSAREYTPKSSQDIATSCSCSSSQTTIEVDRPSRTQVTERAPYPATAPQPTPQRTGVESPIEQQRASRQRATSKQVPQQRKPTDVKQSSHLTSLHEPRKAPSSPSPTSTKTLAPGRRSQSHVSRHTIPLRPSRFTSVPAPRFTDSSRVEPIATRGASASTQLPIRTQTAGRETGTDEDADGGEKRSASPNGKKRVYQAYATSSSDREGSLRSEDEDWRDVYA